MRAARLQAPGDLRVAEEPEPAAGAGMSLVRVTAVVGEVKEAFGDAAHRTGPKVIIEPQR